MGPRLSNYILPFSVLNPTNPAACTHHVSHSRRTNCVLPATKPALRLCFRVCPDLFANTIARSTTKFRSSTLHSSLATFSVPTLRPFFRANQPCHLHLSSVYDFYEPPYDTFYHVSCKKALRHSTKLWCVWF